MSTRASRALACAPFLPDSTRRALTPRRSIGWRDARALFATPIAIAYRILARRIAEVGERDSTRIGLEKIETLAVGLRDALKERRAHSANVAGAIVRLTAKGRLSFAPEPPRKSSKR